MSLWFKKATNKKDIEAIYQHNIDVFSDSPDFEWSLKAIEDEVSDGWKLYGVYEGNEIVAALFYKVEDNKLLTKNTAIKMNFQGSGYSHKIKEFFESIAKDNGVKSIYHYCSIDNFRAYSLNESHKYKKTANKLGDKMQVVEWVKKL